MDNIYTFDQRKNIQAEARRWLIKLDADAEPSSKDITELREWVSRGPLHRQELLRVSAFWDDANILTELSIPLHSKPRQKHRPWFSGLFAQPRGAVYAGTFAVLCLLAVFILPLLQSTDMTITNGLYVSAIGELQEQTLADGSTVTLNTDSQIQVDYTHEVRKIRLLRGEAHFTVASNAHWPFEVYAGKGMVRAVGTAFAVHLVSDEIQVIVSQGRVELAALVEQSSNNGNATAEPVTRTQLKKIGSLAMGQSASFSNLDFVAQRADSQLSSKIHTLTEQELARQLSWREGYLVFAGDTLAHVVAEVNRYQPTQVKIVDPALRELRIGGRFKVGELEAMLDVLESGFDLQVTRLDDQSIQLRGAP
jgi:transmembrane sensor